MIILSTWHNTGEQKHSLETGQTIRLANYRIRISLDYRMIVHWQPGKLLRILDVIPRQDLESWIKRHG